MTKRITLATVKSFINKNEGKLFVNPKSRFDGMVDMVTPNEGSKFNPAEPSYTPHKNNFNMRGVWFVFDGGDSYTAYDDGKYQGFDVYNCCGNFIIAVEKQA